MSMGAERAESEPDTGYALIATTEADWLGSAESPEQQPSEAAAQPMSGKVKGLAALLVLLGIAWVAAFAWSIVQARPAPSLANMVGWTATLSGPLILLALLWLWL